MPTKRLHRLGTGWASRVSRAEQKRLMLLPPRKLMHWFLPQYLTLLFVAGKPNTSTSTFVPSRSSTNLLIPTGSHCCKHRHSPNIPVGTVEFLLLQQPF